MGERFLIGLDYGSESARGVLVSLATGEAVKTHARPYRHGVISQALPGGEALPAFWFLQDAPDYEECAAEILTELGRGRNIDGIGVDFTASTVLPAFADGTPLSLAHPRRPHAYVKLWKHAASQPYADALQAPLQPFLDDVGGKLSANSLIARAAEFAAEAPDLWAEAARFIEAGDWLVWRLTGREARSSAFAAFKALHRGDRGYPEAVAGLAGKLAPPLPVGTCAGALSEPWRRRTGIDGAAAVAVAVIDSHAALPAAGAVESGAFVGALGTSAVYLLLDRDDRPLPPGIEGAARDAMLPGLRGYEAGQASFGDALAWFVRHFPKGADLSASFAHYNRAAGELAPGASGLVALDWQNGNRVPHGDARLSGLLVGQTLSTTPEEIYRALMEALCFGARAILDIFSGGGLPVGRVLMTSGLALNNPALMQIMADVLGLPIETPRLAELTAVGAAIHGGVAAGAFSDYAAGACRIGARESLRYAPDPVVKPAYDALYGVYRALSDNAANRAAMLRLAEIKTARRGEIGR